MTAKPQCSSFLDTKDVARQLGVSEKSVRRWIERGELKVHRFGRSIRIAQDDLIAYVAQQRR
jgi:excisionase family DNA binding protein